MKRHRRTLAVPILCLAVAVAQPAAAGAGEPTPVAGYGEMAGADRPGEAAPGVIGPGVIGPGVIGPGVIGDVGFDAIQLAEIEFPAYEFPVEPSPFADRGGASVEALPGAALASIAGREDVNQAVNSRNVATVASNSVGDNSKTGEVTIADNAFENLSGLSVININTGNNVAVNGAINVNISLTGP